MKKHETACGVVFALITVLVVIISLGMSTHSPWYAMPLEAVNGTAFAFGYFFRLPAWGAYGCALAFFAALAAMAYWIGKKLSHCLLR